MTKEELTKILQNAHWTFARTMPYLPHWYILEKKWEDKEEFAAMVQAVNRLGVKERFGKREFIYFYADDFKYWAMTIGDGSGIINRAKVKKCDAE